MTTSIAAMTIAFLSGTPAAAPSVRRIIGAALLGLSLLAAGCSAIKLAYEGLPNISYYWVDGYVDLDDAQAPQVREALAGLHQWHRRNELPLYAGLLERAARLAPGEVTAPQACALFDDMRERFVTLLGQAEPAVSALAVRLSPAQLQQLEKKYAKNNRDYREEWIDVTPEKRRERRYESILKRSEDFYGRLTREQRQMVRAQVDASIFDPSLMLAERMRRQDDALRTLRQLQAGGADATAARPQVHAWLERGLRSPDAAYRDYEQRLRAESCRIFAQAHATTTPEQREKARQRLLAYQADVRQLASR